MAYLRIDFYSKFYLECSDWNYANFHPDGGKCHSVQLWTYEGPYILAFITTILDNRTITRETFFTANCTGEPHEILELSESELTSNECSGSMEFSTNAIGLGASSGAVTQNTNGSVNSRAFFDSVVLFAALISYFCLWLSGVSSAPSHCVDATILCAINACATRILRFQMFVFDS